MPSNQLRLIVAASVAGVCVLAALVGGPVTAIVAIITGGCILQGLWRGASEILGLLVGMFFGAVLCRPVGRAFEGVVASIAGTSGLTNRFVSVGIAAIVIALVVSVGASFAIKRAWKAKKSAWMKWDHVIGGGVGLVEGAFLSLMVLWTPLMIEPIANAEVALDQQLGLREGEAAMAKRVAGWASAVRGSAFGGLASATNPATSSPVLQLLEDFIAVARNPEAMEHFFNSEPVQRLKNMPSVSDAVRRLEADPDLSGLITGSPSGGTPAGTNPPNAPLPDDEANAVPPITGETIRAILSSNTLLKVLDETTVVQDLAPLAGEIGNALREAKAIVTRKSLAPPVQPIQRPPGGG